MAWSVRLSKRKCGLKRSFDVLVDQQDRLALRRQAFDRLVDDGRDAWLDASGGLVDEQDGIVHQAAGDLKLALLSAAQRASRLPAPVTQHRELFARSAYQLVNASALAAVAPGAQPQVHLDAEILKDAQELSQIYDAVHPQLIRPDGPQRLPVQTDLSVPRRQKAEEHLQ